jgi:ABC-type uncharacterized transport system ATPase subunit
VHRRRARPRRRHDPLRRAATSPPRPPRSAHAPASASSSRSPASCPQLSVYDNILLALQAQSSLKTLIWSATRRALHERVLAALDHVALLDRADDPAGVLSHGEQQWLEIAMTLVSDPTLVLLDEPTAGMSLEERRVTGKLLSPIKQQCAILIVEHDLDFIRDVSDVLTVLDQGSVLDWGTIDEIRRSRKVQEVYLSRA